MNKKLFLGGFLIFALVLTLGLTSGFKNVASAHSDDNDGVDDINKVDVEKLSSSLGRFHIKGVVTAVNVSSSLMAVNGLNLNIPANVNIRGGDRRSLADLAVDNRVEVSGRIENGVLNVDKIRVKGVKEGVKNRSVSSDKIEKIRGDLNSRIADILKKITELQRKIDEKLGKIPTVTTPTSSAVTPTP